LPRMRERRTTLRDRACLITGAASGIGRATAAACAERGADLVLTDIDAAGLERTVAETTAAGGTILHSRPMDITERDAIAAMAGDVHAAHGSMDVLMNVAGVSTWGSVDRLEERHWRKMVEVNLMGPIAVIECFTPPMIEAGRGGHVVNVSSAAGLFGLPWHAAYSASKFGLRGVSEVLRFDLSEHGIGVSLVCPGAVRTPLVESVEILGVDRESPPIRRMVARFERHAVTPERVAGRILEAIEKDRYLVFTSRDIQLLHFLQRHLDPIYRLVMRMLNRQLLRAVRGSA
jgi:NAD(P)-dependent dehydrogenase (short-subunit alcohol dehydrogenase family)